jgi:outer membrane protein TolC
MRTAALAARGAEQRILNSYQAGLSAYTDVVTAQANALGARRELQLRLRASRRRWG